MVYYIRLFNIIIIIKCRIHYEFYLIILYYIVSGRRVARGFGQTALLNLFFLAIYGPVREEYILCCCRNDDIIANATQNESVVSHPLLVSWASALNGNYFSNIVYFLCCHVEGFPFCTIVTIKLLCHDNWYKSLVYYTINLLSLVCCTDDKPPTLTNFQTGNYTLSF